MESGLTEAELIIPVGVVCDKCNNRRLSLVDDELASWPPVSIFRSIGQIPNRRGNSVDASDGSQWHVQHDRNRPLEFRIDAIGDTGPASGIDNVVRALCKIAVEVRWMIDEEDARIARWDPLAAAAIGGPIPKGIAMGLSRPPNLQSIDLSPACDVIVDEGQDQQFRMCCKVKLASLQFSLLLNTPPMALPQTTWWDLDPKSGTMKGPKFFAVSFQGRAKEATQMPPETPINSRRSSRLPAIDGRVALHIERPR